MLKVSVRMLTGEQHDGALPDPSEGGHLQGLLGEFLVEKEIHDNLKSMERHLDAFLLVEQLKERMGREHRLTTSANGHPEGIKEIDIADFIENDPGFVETAFRRHMVAEVYRDLEKPECLARLDHAPAETGELIAKMRIDLHAHRSKRRSDLHAAFLRTKEKGTTEDSKQPSLLSRVLAQTTHPLLASQQPTPWREVVNDGPDMKIHLRNYRDNPEKLSFRLEGIVAAPLICILSVLNEVDLFSTWVPYFTTPFKLGLRKVDNEKLGRVDQMVQFHIDFPWPFANRDACFEVFAVDDFERNSQIVVKMITLDHTCKTPRQNMEIPPPGGRVERILVDGSLVIKPLGPEASFISLLWHENCRMRVPAVMADFAARLFARSAFQAFKHACEAAKGGQLMERRHQNIDLYGFITDRLAQMGLAVQPQHGLALQPECHHAEEDTDDGEEFFDVDDSPK